MLIVRDRPKKYTVYYIGMEVGRNYAVAASGIWDSGRIMQWRDLRRSRIYIRVKHMSAPRLGVLLQTSSIHPRPPLTFAKTPSLKSTVTVNQRWSNNGSSRPSSRQIRLPLHIHVHPPRHARRLRQAFRKNRWERIVCQNALYRLKGTYAASTWQKAVVGKERGG
jgi:hypothetical protein